jgi:hypothetical protein
MSGHPSCPVLRLRYLFSPAKELNPDAIRPIPYDRPEPPRTTVWLAVIGKILVTRLHEIGLLAALFTRFFIGEPRIHVGL